jgi:hypothetical protein
MNDRAIKVAIVAVASFVLSAGGFVASESLEVFAACRVLYPTRDPVQDSLACQCYAAISLFSLLLLAAAVVLAVAAGWLMLARSRAADRAAR